MEIFMISIKNQKDFFAGILLLLFGIGLCVFSQDLQIGSNRQMGPRYFPLILSALNIIIGIILAFRSFKTSSERIEFGPWHPIALIAASVVFFGFLIDRTGLAIAAFATLIIASCAGPEFKLREALLLYCIVIVPLILLFINGLGLPMSVWRAPWN